jgi:hypothetical protein
MSLEEEREQEKNNMTKQKEVFEYVLEKLRRGCYQATLYLNGRVYQGDSVTRADFIAWQRDTNARKKAGLSNRYIRKGRQEVYLAA